MVPWTCGHQCVMSGKQGALCRAGGRRAPPWASGLTHLEHEGARGPWTPVLDPPGWQYLQGLAGGSVQCHDQVLPSPSGRASNTPQHCPHVSFGCRELQAQEALQNGQLSSGDGLPDLQPGVLASQAMIEKVLGEDPRWQGNPGAPLMGVGQPLHIRWGLRLSRDSALSSSGAVAAWDLASGLGSCRLPWTFAWGSFSAGPASVAVGRGLHSGPAPPGHPPGRLAQCPAPRGAHAPS